MKKTLIFSVSIFLLIMCVPSVYAWGNGSYGNNQTYYDYETDYGTHDWIADKALSVLYADNAETWQWLMDRRTIFLVGTEAPDNSGVSMILDGTLVEGFGDTTMHHIYFDESGNVLEHDASDRAKWCGDWANVYISEDKLDNASFFLGSMCHYISDMSVYCHVKPESYFDDYHTAIEGYIDTRTDKENDREEFFKFSSINIENQAPFDVAEELAWNTCDDTADGQDAQWLYDNHFTGWVQDYEDRAGDTTIHKQYYNRIEELLNLAIKGCADAISYELDYDPTNNGGDETGDTWYYYIIVIAVIAAVLIIKLKN